MRCADEIGEYERWLTRKHLAIHGWDTSNAHQHHHCWIIYRQNNADPFFLIKMKNILDIEMWLWKREREERNKIRYHWKNIQYKMLWNELVNKKSMGKIILFPGKFFLNGFPWCTCFIRPIDVNNISIGYYNR